VRLITQINVGLLSTGSATHYVVVTMMEFSQKEWSDLACYLAGRSSENTVLLLHVLFKSLLNATRSVEWEAHLQCRI
jgi:hypothetical protein